MTTTQPTRPQAQPTDPAGVTGRLATWLSRLTADQVPERVRRRAAHLALDGVACALVGAKLPWSRTAVEAVRRLDGTGDSLVIGWGTTLPAPAACLLNGTFIQGFELDDYHPQAPLHSNSLVLPSVLATLGGVGPRTGRDVLTAVIAGFEVGPRVGLALHGGQMLTRGWHSGAVFGTHASAAASGVLRGLTAAQFEDALGLAATQSGGLMAAQYEAMSKRMHHGFAARNGYYAAGLAAAGYTGIKRVYERDYGGFLSTFGEGHDPQPAQITAGLGDTWQTETIAVKAYAAMGGTHAPADCVLHLRDTGLRAPDVAAIDVWVSEAVYHHGWWTPLEPPLETIGAQMNIGYAVAVALLDGEILPRQFTRARIESTDVWDLLSRIQVHHEPAFDATRENLTRARVTITTRSGRQHTTEVAGPRGGLTNPLSNADIVTKSRTLTADVTPPTTWQRIESLVLGLDDLDDVTELVELLARPAHNLNIGL
ncbi:MmgE/PrpD family protein [Microbispora sp. NPDC046933]|uniref:MmgE/PrpD family protein n=1 Tax=Microbispora sp. NPDC046933 TaxID=3155618 RepID=UPI0033D08304